MELIESHNQCPDCLSMEIEVTPLAEEETEFELYLTCKFNQQQENILDGKIRFGIRGGILELSGENAFISEIYSNSNPLALPTKDNNYPLATVGWQIRGNVKGEILKENLEKIKIGKIKVLKKPYYLQATFIVKRADICVTDIEGLWKHDLSPNKHGILERKIANFIEEINLSPYLSKTVFAATDFSLKPHIFHQQDQNSLNQATSKLHKIIETIYQAKTNNVTELADLAELNLREDFAGGNFVGGDLSNMDWSGANLEEVNFRGTILTDADLSDSNLSYAKLNGADLSGAYLEGANLEGTNFNSASLALANLIGADLTDAKFINTNLTNTNFFNAKVTGTVFENNMGLSAENKENLQTKGAIFL